MAEDSEKSSLTYEFPGGEARESRGRFKRCRHLLRGNIVAKLIATLDDIIGRLTKTIETIENKQKRGAQNPSTVTRHSPLST